VSYVGASIEPLDSEFVSSTLRNLSFIGIETIAALETAYRQNEQDITAFAKRWVSGSKYEYLSEGIGMFYLTYVVLAKTGDRERIVRWAETSRIPAPQAVVEQVLSTAKAVGIRSAI
jgi:hypothetical protein